MAVLKEIIEMLEERLRKHIDLLIERYPKLKEIEQPIIDAYLVMEEAYENGGKLLIAGNGGSAADSEHIAGELMKRFKTPRPVSEEYAKKLREADPERGASLAKNLEQGLMAIPLVAHVHNELSLYSNIKAFKLYSLQQ